MSQEIYKDVVGYEGDYKISNKGNVKSFKTKKSKVLKPGIQSNGYLGVGLTKDSKLKSFTIHQLMAVAFLNHKPNGATIIVDHIDNDKLNNLLENLQLVTLRENSSKDKKGRSKYTGVSWNKLSKKWQSTIVVNYKRMNLGHYDTEIEASNAYQDKLKEIEK